MDFLGILNTIGNSAYLSGALAVLAGLLFILVELYRKKTAEIAKKEWLTTEGVIINSLMREKTDYDDGRCDVDYEVVIRYSYSVGDRYLRNDVIKAGSGVNKFQHKEYAASLVERYPMDSTVKVYYNPRNPKQSALELDTSAIHPFFIIGGSIFITIGVYVLWNTYTLPQ